MPRVTLQDLRTVAVKFKVQGGWTYQTDVYHGNRYVGAFFIEHANHQTKGWTVAAQDLGGGRIEHCDSRWLLEQLNKETDGQAPHQA